ncbi:hypothetical protein FA95DRAFT_1562250 [Auriscalpium vulgare]|uniref:Uncharacterized protein n=1 Tax=Auriscalpium vulgare TaxID=40419 RepID=A0ACB8RJS9_9AGAM|nr:hypothetical protein FA95DRAFT_1562250 [Auriscalpium vulgare]
MHAATLTVKQLGLESLRFLSIVIPPVSPRPKLCPPLALRHCTPLTPACNQRAPVCCAPAAPFQVVHTGRTPTALARRLSPTTASPALPATAAPTPRRILFAIGGGEGAPQRLNHLCGISFLYDERRDGKNRPPETITLTLGGDCDEGIIYE